nr:hypothetical protein GCM10010200_044730 [Actinomadura rugatobispora]
MFVHLVTLFVFAGLMIGKFVGVFGGALASRRAGPVTLGRNRIGGNHRGRDACRTGFTISLLIGGLTYTDPAQFERVTTAVPIESGSPSARVCDRHRRLPEAGAPAEPTSQRGSGACPEA